MTIYTSSYRNMLEREKGEHDLFLLCFENVLAGEVCHRRWLAEILEKGFSLQIPEYLNINNYYISLL